MKKEYEAPFCKVVTETGQRYGCAGTGKFNDRLVNPDSAEENTDDHITDQNTRGGKLCFVDENLTQQTENTTHQKSFDIVHFSPSL